MVNEYEYEIKKWQYFYLLPIIFMFAIANLLAYLYLNFDVYDYLNLNALLSFVSVAILLVTKPQKPSHDDESINEILSSKTDDPV